MNRTQFKEAFKRGLGSAYIELKKHTSREKFKDIVLWCCLHNTCYDAQCEDGRGSYLYRSISLYEDKTFFEDSIIQQFLEKKLNTWLFDQLCDLLFEFSMGGSLEARSALYRKYDELFSHLSRRRNIESVCDERDKFEWLCVWLTSLDGFKAFKKVVDQIGSLLINAKNTNAINFDWFYRNSQNKFGEKRVSDYLHNNSAKNKTVEAFLNEITKIEGRTCQPRTAPSLDELINACKETTGYRSRGIALRFARNASAEELTTLAQLALNETNPDIQLGLLWAFRKTPFPLDDHFVFELSESNNESIREIAFEMMQYLPPNKIHDYVINLIKEKKEVVNCLCLLCHCLQLGDETLLVDGVKGLSVSYNDGGWHAVFMDVADLLDKRSFKIDPSLFVYMYRQTLCSSCRSDLVQKMFKRKILPQEILEECLYDSYENTRKFAARKML